MQCTAPSAYIHGHGVDSEVPPSEILFQRDAKVDAVRATAVALSAVTSQFVGIFFLFLCRCTKMLKITFYANAHVGIYVRGESGSEFKRQRCVC